jgi:hypothetical protein
MIPDSYKNILLGSMYEHIYTNHGDNLKAINIVSFSLWDTYLAKNAPELITTEEIGDCLKSSVLQTLKTEDYLINSDKPWHYHLTEKGFNYGRNYYHDIKPTSETQELSPEQNIYNKYPIRVMVFAAIISGTFGLIIWQYLKPFFE